MYFNLCGSQGEIYKTHGVKYILSISDTSNFVNVLTNEKKRIKKRETETKLSGQTRWSCIGKLDLRSVREIETQPEGVETDRLLLLHGFRRATSNILTDLLVSERFQKSTYTYAASLAHVANLRRLQEELSLSSLAIHNVHGETLDCVLQQAFPLTTISCLIPFRLVSPPLCFNRSRIVATWSLFRMFQSFRS